MEFLLERNKITIYEMYDVITIFESLVTGIIAGDQFDPAFIRAEIHEVIRKFDYETRIVVDHALEQALNCIKSLLVEN